MDARGHRSQWPRILATAQRAAEVEGRSVRQGSGPGEGLPAAPPCVGETDQRGDAGHAQGGGFRDRKEREVRISAEACCRRDWVLAFRELKEREGRISDDFMDGLRRVDAIPEQVLIRIRGHRAWKALIKESIL